MGKSSEEFIKWLEKEREEAHDERSMNWINEMEKGYYEAKRKAELYNSQEYKDRVEATKRALNDVFYQFHPETWNYGK